MEALHVREDSEHANAKDTTANSMFKVCSTIISHNCSAAPDQS